MGHKHSGNWERQARVGMERQRGKQLRKENEELKRCQPPLLTAGTEEAGRRRTAWKIDGYFMAVPGQPGGMAFHQAAILPPPVLKQGRWNTVIPKKLGEELLHPPISPSCWVDV